MDLLGEAVAMAGEVFEVVTPEALERALQERRAGELLAFRPEGAEQYSLLRVGGRVAYCCDLDRRAPTKLVRSIVQTAGLELNDINAKERRADQMAGFVPTTVRLTQVEAIKRMVSVGAASTVELPSDTRLSRMFATFFGRRATKLKNVPDQPDNASKLKR